MSDPIIVTKNSDGTYSIGSVTRPSAQAQDLFSGYLRSYQNRKNWVAEHKDYLKEKGANIDWDNYSGTVEQNLALKRLLDGFDEWNVTRQKAAAPATSQLNYTSYFIPEIPMPPLAYDNTLASDNTRVYIGPIIEPLEVAFGNYTVLPYETPSNLSSIAEQELRTKVDLDLSGKSKEEIKEIQRKAAEAGYYDLFLRGLSKSLIVSLLKKLKKRSLYDGPIDGIIGKKTISAYRQYNIDGIVGNRTRSAYRQMLSPDINYSYGATCTPDTGCAAFVTHSYDKSTNTAVLEGVVGDAWRMPMNIVESGGQEIYNIYKDKRFEQNRENPTIIKNLHSELLAANKLDLSSLKPGDVVGMYNPGSSYQTMANRNGTTFNTHVGLVVGLDTDGMPIIEHNMHGDVRRERADKLGKRLISVAVRPKTAGRIPSINWELLKSDYFVDEEVDNDNLKIYRDSMAGVAPIIAKIFPDVPMDKMLLLALGILGRETNFMNDLESNRSGVAGFKRDAEQWIRANIFKEGASSKSSDLTKMKFTSFTPEERQFLGINSPVDLNDPKKAGAAVLYLLSKNYNYMNKYQETYPEFGLTDDDKFNATALSYNYGMRENSPTRSIGFNSKTGVLDTLELEWLREHSDENTTVDSYPATKYAKIDKLLNFTNFKPGRFIYNLIGKDREGYAATALKNINKYIHKDLLGAKINYLKFYT